MSFGYSAGELLGFAQLTWKIVQNSRRACGEHHGLTREVKSLHSALKRLEQEASAAESAETSTEPTSSKDLKRAIRGCVRVLRELDGILEKYSSLSERELTVKKLWSKVRFGNSEMQELSRYRVKISTYLGIIMLHLNVSTGSEMRKIKVSIDGIAAKMASGHEGSLLTSYGDDDKAAWKELRRELHREGFEDSFIRENRHSIMDYVRDLGDKGAFDDAESSVVIGGSVDDEISDTESETDDFTKENAMSEWDKDEEAPHEEECQFSTGSPIDASISVVELSQREEVEQQMDPSDHTSEEPRRDDNSGPRSHQKSLDKKSIDKQQLICCAWKNIGWTEWDRLTCNHSSCRSDFNKVFLDANQAIPTCRGIPKMCFRSTLRISLDSVNYFIDPDQPISVFTLDIRHRDGRKAQSVAKRGDPIPEASSRDHSSISKEFLYEVSSLQFNPVFESSKESLSSSCVEDAVPDKLGFWKLLVERGLSDSIIEKLRDFMCGEIESLGWTGRQLFEIIGYDEEIQWMLRLDCKLSCTNVRTIQLSGAFHICSRNEDGTGWRSKCILTANNSRRMLVYE